MSKQAFTDALLWTRKRSMSVAMDRDGLRPDTVYGEQLSFGHCGNLFEGRDAAGYQRTLNDLRDRR